MAALRWAQPDQVMVETPDVRCVGWLEPYSLDRIPALWRRVTELEAEPDGWLSALKAYGPLDRFDETVPEERVRDAWKYTVKALATVARLWTEHADGIFALPASHPIELTGAFRVLQANLNSAVVDSSVRLVVRGLDVVPEPVTLAGFLWLAAAEAVRDQHRFRRCERCQEWMRIQQTDARFCSAACRNWRSAPASDATTVAAG
jgi:hypothetical protein